MFKIIVLYITEWPVIPKSSPQTGLDIWLQSIGIGIALLAANSSDTRTTPNKRIYQKSKYGRANHT